MLNKLKYYYNEEQSYYINFQVDLKSISAEIQTLQEQSLRMNIRLKNRQVNILIFFKNMSNFDADSCVL